MKPMDPEVWKAMSQEERKIEMVFFLEAIGIDPDKLKRMMDILDDPEWECGE